MTRTSVPAALTRRSMLTLLASAAMSPALAASAAGVPAAFPKSQITLVVPFSAGGPVDLLGRLLAQDYQARSGVTTIVENKTGGAGNIGIETVRKAWPEAFIVVPGVRPADAVAADQKRVVSPRQALDAGASILVVGRPITQADDPDAAARAIAATL